jgi:hypothetical protein
VLVWAAVYVALVVVAAVIVLARREPTVVRGDWVFLLTALYVLVAAAVTAVRGGRFSLGVLAGTVIVLMAGWLVQSRWWVIGAASSVVAVTIDECASRLCAPAASRPGECEVTVPGGAIRLRIMPAGRGSTMIVFVASAKHRKSELFRRLLAKQYRSVMPTIRLGILGGSRNA